MTFLPYICVVICGQEGKAVDYLFLWLGDNVWKIAAFGGKLVSTYFVYYTFHMEHSDTELGPPQCEDSE
jgi:hypothetical protein